MQVTVTTHLTNTESRLDLIFVGDSLDPHAIELLPLLEPGARG